MLVIRLQRTGRRNVPAYRIAACEKSAPVKGRVKEYLGHYLPTRDPHVLEFDKERVEHWVKMGAQPSDTVARLLKREGVDNMDKFIEKYTKKKKRKEKKGEVKAAPKPAAPSEEKAAEAEQPSVAATPSEKKEEAADDAKSEKPAEEPKEENKEPEKPQEETPKPEGDAEEKKE